MKMQLLNASDFECNRDLLLLSLFSQFFPSVVIGIFRDGNLAPFKNRKLKINVYIFNFVRFQFKHVNIQLPNKFNFAPI